MHKTMRRTMYDSLWIEVLCTWILVCCVLATGKTVAFFCKKQERKEVCKFGRGRTTDVQKEVNNVKI